jgi:chromosome segregation ATPase
MTQEPDITHTELMARFNKRLDDQINLFEDKMQSVIERLEAGGGRFTRLEGQQEDARRERADLMRELRRLNDRLLAIEQARAITAAVDEEMVSRADKWRRRIFQVLLVLFGQGGAITITIWWLSRHPPTP